MGCPMASSQSKPTNWPHSGQRRPPPENCGLGGQLPSKERSMAIVSLMRCGLLLVGLAGLLAGEAAADAAKKNYRLYCMGCHQADGAGSPENGIPSMRDEVGHFLRVPEGRAYLSQVPGTLNTPLSDGETAALLNWVRVNIGRSSTPANFKHYTADDVRAYRANVTQDIPGMRVRLVKQLETIQLGAAR